LSLIDKIVNFLIIGKDVFDITDEDVDHIVNNLLLLNDDKLASEKVLCKWFEWIDKKLCKVKNVEYSIDSMYLLHLLFNKLINNSIDKFDYIKKKEKSLHRKNNIVRKEINYSRSIGAIFLTSVEDLQNKDFKHILFKGIDLEKSKYYKEFFKLAKASNVLDEYILNLGYYPREGEVIE